MFPRIQKLKLHILKLDIEFKLTGAKFMKRYDLWDAFAKTGRIEDYLRYRGVDVYNLKNMKNSKEEPQRDDNRRPDYQGEQQYW